MVLDLILKACSEVNCIRFTKMQFPLGLTRLLYACPVTGGLFQLAFSFPSANFMMLF